MMELLRLLPHVVVAFVLIEAALVDFRTFRISNRTCLVVLLAWPVSWLLDGPLPSPMSAALAFLLVSSVLGLQWRIGHSVRRLRFGGGDWKLLSALAPWAGLGGLLPLALTTALTGGLLSILVVALRLAVPPESRLRQTRWLGPVLAAGGVPYGVAIAVGGLSVILDAAVLV